MCKVRHIVSVAVSVMLFGGCFRADDAEGAELIIEASITRDSLDVLDDVRASLANKWEEYGSQRFVIAIVDQSAARTAYLVTIGRVPRSRALGRDLRAVLPEIEQRIGVAPGSVRVVCAPTTN
jgi:hypothetical protein